jgi:hypothetical protein
MDWILDLLTQLGTASNNSAIAGANIKSFSVCSVLTSRSLATASNCEDSSLSRAQVLLSQPASAEAEGYCRQSVGTVIPGIEPRWDPWS